MLHAEPDECYCQPFDAEQVGGVADGLLIAPRPRSCGDRVDVAGCEDKIVMGKLVASACLDSGSPFTRLMFTRSSALVMVKYEEHQEGMRAFRRELTMEEEQERSM